MAALAQPHPRRMSLEEALDAGYRDALDGRPVAEAAAEYAVHLDLDEIGKPLSIGLAELIHRRLGLQHREQGGADVYAESDANRGPAAPALKSKPHYAKEFWRSILARNYEAADGTRKALAAFTVDDAKYLRNLAANRADGLMRLRDAMDAACSALSHGRATTIGDLPVKEQQKIAEALS